MRSPRCACAGEARREAGGMGSLDWDEQRRNAHAVTQLARQGEGREHATQQRVVVE